MPLLVGEWMAPVAERLVPHHEDSLEKMRLGAVANLLALPLVLPVFSLFATLAKGKNETPWPNVTSLAIGLALTPFLLLAGYSLMAAFQAFSGTPGQEHPLVLLHRSGRVGDAWLVLGLVIVAAPITEEVLFRGLFQQWIVSAGYGPLLGLTMAFLLVLCKLKPLELASGNGILWAQIGGFMLIGGAAVGWLFAKSQPKWAAILAGGMVFAAVHSFAWPTPVGLLPLAWGLGWLREYTGRLWPCVMVHAMFNAAGALMM